MDVFAARNEAQAAVEANKTIVDYTLKAERARRDYSQKNVGFEGTPEEWSQGYQDIARKLLDDTVNSVQSPAARQLVAKHGEQIYGSQVLKAEEDAVTNQITTTAKSVVDTNNFLAQSAMELGADPGMDLPTRREGLQALLRQSDSTVVAASGVLGAKQTAQFATDSPKSIAKGFLMGAIDGDPAGAIQMLKDKEISRHFTPEEKTQLQKAAGAALMKQKDQVDTAYVAENLAANTDIWNAYLEGSLTYAQIDAIPDKRFQRIMEDTWFKSSPYTLEQKNSTFMNLSGRLIDLKIKGTGTEAKARENLEKIVDFQKAVFEARDARLLDNGQVTSLLKAVAVPFNYKMKQGADSFWNMFDNVTEPFKQAYEQTKAWAKNEPLLKNQPLYQAEVLVNFQKEIAQFPNPTPKQISVAMERAKAPVAMKLHPELTALGGKKPNEVLKDGTLSAIPGEADAEASVTVKPAYIVEHSKSTGLSSRLYPDGHRELVKE
jgi:hypothetical protein